MLIFPIVIKQEVKVQLRQGNGCWGNSELDSSHLEHFEHLCNFRYLLCIILLVELSEQLVTIRKAIDFGFILFSIE